MRNTFQTKYTEKMLLSALEKYVKDNPTKKVTVTGLSKATGIPRDNWYRHPNVKKQIDKINKTPITVQLKDDFDMPTAEAIMERCKGDPILMQKSIQNLLSVITKQKAQLSSKNIRKLSMQINELEEQVKRQQAEIVHLQHLLDVQAVENINKSHSSEVINQSMDSSTFASQFDDLFDDDNHDD